MRWKGERQSKNVEDRRGSRPKAAMGGLLGIVLMLVLVKCIGGDVGQFLGQVVQQQAEKQQTQTPGEPVELTPEQKEQGEFVSTVLAYTEDVWKEQFRRLGKTYREPTLVLFSGQVRSACGVAGASVGPFYCPSDQKLYIDLTFFRDLANRYRAGGDFAQAYVIAHEIGHHVQHELGLSAPLDRARRQRASKKRINELSVRLELQADFLAGVWAHHAQKQHDILEGGDIEEALRAATAIGDDRLQMEAQGHVVPDSFTHGTSAQRTAWFNHGYVTGDLREGDTFDDRQFARVNPR